MEAEEDAIKPEPEFNGCFKAPYSVDSGSGGGAANESFIHSARLLSCGAILRGVILIYCLSQFGFFFYERPVLQHW